MHKQLQPIEQDMATAFLEEDLALLWESAERPYTSSSHEFITNQQNYESNARTYARRFKLAISKAEGIFVQDPEGRVFIDCLCGAGSIALGHNHHRVYEAIMDCLRNKNALLTLDIATPIKDRFVNMLLESFPASFAENCKIQFCSPSGADAAEAAVKLVKTATGRSTIFAFGGAYHGMTHGALALTGCKSVKEPIHNLMKDVHFMPFPYPYRCPFGVGGDEAEEISLHFIEHQLKDPYSGITKPAAILLEVIQGEGGVIPASDKWIRGIRDITSRYDVPLIIDEVQAGIGKTGDMYAFESSGIVPDVVMISKSIGGSLPLALIAYNKKLDQWKSGAHTGTFRGNQMAMAAGTAVLETIKEERLLENAAFMGKFFKDEFTRLQDKYSCVGDVRGRGLMVGMEIVDSSLPSDQLGSFPGNTELAYQIVAECFRNGLIIETGGRQDCVIRVLPPLNITREQGETIMEIIDNAMATVLA
jgi:diaminobutyrate-2-oxoglutarate transaminase